MTGSLPFSRQLADLPAALAGTEPSPVPPSQLNPDVPPELDIPILRTLQPDPAARYQSASHFWDALEKALRHTDLATSPWFSSLSQPDQPSSPAPLVRRASRPPQKSHDMPVFSDQWRTLPTPSSASYPAASSGSVSRTGHPARLAHRRLLFALAGVGLLLAALFVAFLQFHSASSQAQTRQLSAASSRQAIAPATGTFPGQKAHGRFLIQNNAGSVITLSTTQTAVTYDLTNAEGSVLTSLSSSAVLGEQIYGPYGNWCYTSQFLDADPLI